MKLVFMLQIGQVNNIDATAPSRGTRNSDYGRHKKALSADDHEPEPHATPILTQDPTTCIHSTRHTAQQNTRIDRTDTGTEMMKVLDRTSDDGGEKTPVVGQDMYRRGEPGRVWINE